MDEETLIGSLDRIEAALDRIEAGARKLGTRSVLPPADAELEQRHLQLRTSVETALARLDAVLADQAK